MIDWEDVVMYFIIAVVGLIILGLVAAFIGFVQDERAWDATEAFRHPAKLITMTYHPSRSTSGIAPIFGGKGGIAFHSSTTSEERVTVWDCGEYGNIETASPLVFKHAKDNVILLLKKRNQEIRIVGIIKDGIEEIPE